MDLKFQICRKSHIFTEMNVNQHWFIVTIVIRLIYTFLDIVNRRPEPQMDGW